MIGSVGRPDALDHDAPRRRVERLGSPTRATGLKACAAPRGRSTRRAARWAATRPRVERTVAVLVRLPGGVGRAQGDATGRSAPPVVGAPEVIAEALRGFAREGIGHVQLVIDPITTDRSKRWPRYSRFSTGTRRTFGRGSGGHPALSSKRCEPVRGLSARCNRCPGAPGSASRPSSQGSFSSPRAGLRRPPPPPVRRRRRARPASLDPRISTSRARSTSTGSSSSSRRPTCPSTRRPSRAPARRASPARPCSSWTARSRSRSTASAAPPRSRSRVHPRLEARPWRRAVHAVGVEHRDPRGEPAAGRAARGSGSGDHDRGRGDRPGHRPIHRPPDPALGHADRAAEHARARRAPRPPRRRLPPRRRSRRAKPTGSRSRPRSPDSDGPAGRRVGVRSTNESRVTSNGIRCQIARVSANLAGIDPPAEVPVLSRPGTGPLPNGSRRRSPSSTSGSSSTSSRMDGVRSPRSPRSLGSVRRPSAPGPTGSSSAGSSRSSG